VCGKKKCESLDFKMDIEQQNEQQIQENDKEEGPTSYDDALALCGNHKNVHDLLLQSRD
jgi:hypothetical protein